MTSSGPDPHFFLSFAGDNDTDDRRVTTFFNDLCDDVGVASGAGRSSAATRGFLSLQSLRLGADWSDEIADALGRCRVFVALCSPSYFASASCGVEWRAFQDRLRGYERLHGKPAPALLPVCWVPMRMPGVASGIQYTDGDLSAPMARLGLRRMMRLSQHRDDYQDFVSRLAGLIVDVGRSHPVPPARVGREYDRLPRAFPEPADPVVVKPSALPRSRRANDDARLPDLDRGDGIPRLHGN
jgi:hypothetical protein